MTETVPSSTSLDAYKVDFKWRDFKGVITDNKTNAHIMDVDCKGMRKPQIKFFKGWEEIGTAALNTVSIHAECEIRGRAKRIQAMKRWTTEYTYLSDAFADGGLPVAVYWTSSSGFKYWDFILLDSNKEPVARFRSNVWAYKHVGIIEFMGDFSQLAKEEICITGCTVYLNFLQRANNVFQLFGAIGAKTGPLDANNLDVPKQSVPAQKVDTDFEETRTSTGGTTFR